MPTRPRHSTVVAYLALFIALGGSAYAAAKIGSKQIKDNSVRSRDIKNKTIATKDISPAARKALKGARGAAGAPGAPGTAGAPGAAGPAGPSAVPARAVVVGAGGTPAENGTALRNALSSLPAASAEEPRAVVLGPGRYDLAGAGVTVPSFVTLAGAGAGATIIDSSPGNVKLSLLTLDTRTTIRDLTVTTASSQLGSTGIDESAGDNAVIDRVNVTAGVGVIKRGGIIRNAAVDAVTAAVDARAAGTGRILVIDSSRLSTISSGATSALAASTTFTVTNSQLFAASTGATATGIRYTATSGVAEVRATLIDTASGGEARGVSVEPPNGSSRVEVDHSKVQVAGAQSRALRASVGDVRAGATQLTGTTATELNGGQISCFDTYSATYDVATC